jgi:hypothetical protein
MYIARVCTRAFVYVSVHVSVCVCVCVCVCVYVFRQRTSYNAQSGYVDKFVDIVFVYGGA